MTVVQPTSTTTGTASLESALTHARAQADAAAASAGVTMPPSAATDLPIGVDALDVRWDETLSAGDYTSLVMRRDDIVRVVDLDGATCVNVQVFDLANPLERLSPADTVKVQWQAYPELGTLLLSDLGRVLMTVVADSSGRHDALCGHTNGRSGPTGGGGPVHGADPNARDLLALAGARHGLGRRDLTGGINLFTAVRIGDDGSLTLVPGTDEPAHVELRAELDVIVLLAVVRHPLTEPDSRPGPVRTTVWTAPRVAPDPWRTSTPERTRAFENAEAAARVSTR